ncbi:MAG TPA: hypothetical protein VLT57_08810 [Bryobacteraceae bacterium]|nr:hypothetical protein [Bryobacteraceae bacterium]
MRIKSYFASTVEGALSEARRELGPDAILIESRRSATESRRLGAYEVVCALAAPKPGAPGTAARPGQEPAAEQDGIPPSQGLRSSGPAAGRTSEQLSHLNDSISAFLDRLDGLTRQLRGAESSALRRGASRETARAIDILENAEVDAHLIPAILEADNPAGDRAADTRPDALARRIAAQARIDCQLGKPKAARKIVAVVGPPGAGKTTTLVKLAARYGLGARRPSLILSVDTQRVASSEALRAYAAILGAGFQALETPRALAQVLQDCQGKEWIWIDTPGLSRKEMEDARELAHVVAGEPDIDVHLVLPASMRASDLQHTIQQFRPFRPSKLLFTRLDETSAYGPLLNESERSGLPISFLSDGPQIPEDLMEASGPLVARLILGGSALCEAGAPAAPKAASAAA